MRWLGVLALIGCGGEEEPAEPLGLCDACGDVCAEEFAQATSAGHVFGGVDYADPPPSSGDHDACWATWGAHAEPVPDELWVHNLEHGGVVYLYHCPDGCDAEVAELTALVDRLGIFALVTPYDALPTRFAAVAWEWRYTADCFDIDALEAFYTSRRDQAPESVTSDPSVECQAVADGGS